jgi:hypothetical protein
VLKQRHRSVATPTWEAVVADYRSRNPGFRSEVLYAPPLRDSVLTEVWKRSAEEGAAPTIETWFLGQTFAGPLAAVREELRAYMRSICAKAAVPKRGSVFSTVNVAHRGLPPKKEPPKPHPGGGAIEMRAMNPLAAAVLLLPRGWTGTVSATSGATYYTNTHTQETTWEKPVLPAPPPGWRVRPHEEHGQYYQNIDTDETSWVHPHDQVQPPVALLPRGWTLEHSVEHTADFYRNDHTQESQWDTPEHPAPPVGWTVVPHGDSRYYQSSATGEVQWEYPLGEAAAGPNVHHASGRV